MQKTPCFQEIFMSKILSRNRLFGAGIGIVLSIVVGVIYIVILKEPGSLFYTVAGFACFGGPLAGGIAAVVRVRRNKLMAFFASSGMALGIAFFLSVIMYVVSP
jgi:hypothetical protein